MTAPGPPAVLERLLDRALAGAPYREDIVGDLHEAFVNLAARRSLAYARWWYRVQALRLTARYGIRRRRAPRQKANRMDRLSMDLRFAVRALLKRRGMSAAIVVTLALGLGANAAIFGLIDRLLLRPFSIPDVDRLLLVSETTESGDLQRRETVSPADFLDWRGAGTAGPIEDLAAISWWDANLVGRDEPERVQGFFVSASFFAAIGVQPIIGRGFTADEETIGNERRVVLSDGLWKRRFGEDRAILGQTILVDGAPSTVVGIMPPGFDFPLGAEVWAPLAFDAKTAANRLAQYLTVIGRLAPGRTLRDAQAHLSVVSARLTRDFPQTNRHRDVRVWSLERGMVDAGLGPILSLWQAAALVVLLIACANVGNLLLARGAERGREIAVRLALGAARARLVGETLVESVVLSLVAIPLSLGVTWAGIRILQASLPPRIVRFVAGWMQMGVDARVIGFTLGLAVVAAIVYGSLPAWQIGRGGVAEVLKSDGRSGGHPGRERMRRGLVVAEIALVLPMLVAALLSLSGVRRYLTSWQGYDPSGVLTARLVLPDVRYPDAPSRSRFADAVLAALTGAPGTTGAAIGNILPAIDSNSGRRVEVDGDPVPNVGDRPMVDYRTVTPTYFDLLRMPVVAGRAFTTADRAGTSEVVIVSQSMARKLWPDRSAIGRRIRVGDGPWLTVVGICGDVIHDWFDRRNAPTMYRPFAQAPTGYMSLAIRTAGDPLAQAGPLRQAMARVDATQPLYDVMTMRRMLGDKTVGIQFLAGVMSTFAALALLLALLGLYAVMTYLVTLRVREIGVRMALGATPGDVTRLALFQAARLTAVGLAIGLALSLALGRLMEAGMLGIVSTDTRMSAVLAAVLGATAVLSSYLPARRAAAVDPMTALRAE